MLPPHPFFYREKIKSFTLQIDNECNKYTGQSLPVPSRGVKAREGGQDEGGDEEEGEGMEVPMEDLVPRKSIAPQITDELLEMIKDKNWKIRKEGLDKLKEIVNSAKFITNDLGGLPGALGPRTTDANKILVVQALELVSELILAMGPQTRTQVRKSTNPHTGQKLHKPFQCRRVYT